MVTRAFLFLWRRGCGGIGIRQDVAGLLGAVFAQLSADGRKLYAENGGGEERGVDRARHADGERADRDAAGHLRDGQERVESFEGFGFHGDAEDGENGF